MQIQIKRLDDSIPLPIYHTSESAGFDFTAAVDLNIAAGKVEKIPTGLIIATPPGYFLLITARSSLALKKGLMLANGVGVVDPDYSGPNDQIYIILYNFTNQNVLINKGERLAQGIFLPFLQVNWQEVAVIHKKDRGGLGSTEGYIQNN